MCPVFFILQYLHVFCHFKLNSPNRVFVNVVELARLLRFYQWNTLARCRFLRLMWMRSWSAMCFVFIVLQCFSLSRFIRVRWIVFSFRLMDEIEIARLAMLARYRHRLRLISLRSWSVIVMRSVFIFSYCIPFRFGHNGWIGIPIPIDKLWILTRPIHSFQVEPAGLCLVEIREYLIFLIVDSAREVSSDGIILVGNRHLTRYEWGNLS